MTIQQILEIVQYVVLGLSIVLTVISFIYGKIKGSSSKFLTNCLSFLDEISSSMGFAEKMISLNGEEKKSFASRQIKLYCENKKIKITDEQLDFAIETLIALTNKVNAKVRPEPIIDDLTKENELVPDSATTDTGLSEIKTDNNWHYWNCKQQGEKQNGREIILRSKRYYKYRY